MQHEISQKSKLEIDKLIQKFDLILHPEGGYYKETYRSQEDVEVNYGTSKKIRNISAAIYFLIDSKHFSAWHRVNQDELWFFHAGSSLTVHMIDEKTGQLSHVKIGNPVHDDCPAFFLVPAKVWFAASVDDKSSYSFVSCTTAPAFDFQDFHLAKRDEFLHKFPQHKEIILDYTRG